MSAIQINTINIFELTTCCFVTGGSFSFSFLYSASGLMTVEMDTAKLTKVSGAMFVIKDWKNGLKCAAFSVV